MGIMTFIKILAGLVVLGVIGATAWVVWQAKQSIGAPQVEQERVMSMLEAAEMPDIEPGERAFQKAHELIALGRAKEAKEKLLYIVNFYPTSPSAPEARRILGEMNMDDLLSTEQMEGKGMHTVKRGESFLAIANATQSTLDCLMHLNGLLDLNRLHPGDELVVMPLNLRVTIDAGRKALTLWDGGRFVKEYPLLAADAGVGAQRTTIEGKGGVAGERRVQPGMDGYRESSKRITLAKGGLLIGEMPAAGESPGRGFFLSGPDIEELALVLRVGNEVEILPKSP